MTDNSFIKLDMGQGNEIIDGPHNDFVFYEYANGPGILLDHVAIAVAADDGTGNPGPFKTVFVWGDDDPSNNGSLLPGFKRERSEEPIAATKLINGTGIAIDIGHGDGRAYRFIRLTTYPETAAPGRDKGVEVDAVERIFAPQPPPDAERPGATPSPIPTTGGEASTTPTALPVGDVVPVPTATPTGSAMPSPAAGDAAPSPTATALP
jgi:hypothetical protein